MIEPCPPDHPNPVPFVHVYGSHLEIGQQIGEACKMQIAHSVESARKLLADTFDELQLTWEGAQIQARKYLPFAQEKYPRLVDEILGMAQGSGMNFDDLAVVNAMEAVTMDALHLTKCTSFAVNDLWTADGHILVAHNEDWLPQDEADVYIVHASPTDEPKFLGMTYGGLLVNIGFNEYGLAQCCDSVYADDSRIGIPRVVVSRAVLAARTPAEAIRAMLVSHRAAGYNHLLAHESGEMYNVEVSARSFAVLSTSDGVIAHTNHFLDSKMQEVEDEPDELIDTRVRYFRVMNLLRRTPKHTVRTLQSIQRDHLGFPDSICNHAENEETPMDREKTINSMVMDLTAGVMYLAWGNPCHNPYFTYHL